MKNLRDLSKWKYLKKGDQMVFNATHKRNVSVEIVAATLATVFVATGDEFKHEMPLGVVDGLEKFKFSLEGPYALAASGPIYLYSPEGEEIGKEGNHVSFTNLDINRQQRNPELELMQRRMMQNMERFVGDMSATMDRKLSEQEKRHQEALDNAIKPTGDETVPATPPEPQPQPAPVEGGGATPEPVAPDGVTNEGDG